MSAATRQLSYATYFPRDYGNNLTDDFGTIPVATPEQVHAARLQVALHGGADVAYLLTMLGLEAA